MDARLIHDEPATGAWNMGLDEALREWAETTGGVCLRFYQWSPATLSLGYFQNHQSRTDHSGSRPLTLVRRASGGGAIVHDRELTYSFVGPMRSGSAHPAADLVRTVHQALVDVLTEWHVHTERCVAPSRVPRDREPFLCFQRRAEDDVLLDGHKIAGSAQRRTKGSVLQHGSVLLRRSDHAVELPGICDVAAEVIPLPELRDAWSDRLAAQMSVRWYASQLSPHEKARAAWWSEHRFAAKRWTQKR